MRLPSARTLTRILRGLALLIMLCVLSACGKETLIENTTQKRAVEVVVALYRRGVMASSAKETGGQGKYRVEVSAHDYPIALSIIEREGLMEEPAPSISDLTSTSSFFPSSREMESLRLDYALALEVQQILEALPGVDDAHVLVRKRFGARDEAAPSVSVVIRSVKPELVVSDTVVDVVHRSIPGLDRDKILFSVNQLIDPAKGINDGELEIGSSQVLVPFIFNWRVPKNDYKPFALLFLSCMLLIGAVGTGLGYVLGKLRERRERMQSEFSDMASGNSRIERPRRDLLEG